MICVNSLIEQRTHDAFLQKKSGVEAMGKVNTRAWTEQETAPLIRALMSALKGHGARAIFGIPGDYALPMFRAMEGNRTLPLFTLSHEPAVGFAADAAARYSGGLGVAAATFGAGASMRSKDRREKARIGR